MEKEIIVTWNPTYSVGIKVIDEQHMKLIKLTNKLFRSCMSGQERIKGDSIFFEVIREVIEYVGYHFNTEEKVMERVDYPKSKEHKIEHKVFVKEVLAKVEEFNSGKINTPLSFVYYLRDWILHHIAVNDKKLGEYLLEMKRTGNLQQKILKVKRNDEKHQIQIE
jgi:hemerythrin